MKGKIQRSEGVKGEVNVEKWLMKTCIVCPDVNGIEIINDDIHIKNKVKCNCKNTNRILKDFPIIPIWCPRSSNHSINTTWAASMRTIDAAIPILLNQFISLEDLHSEGPNHSINGLGDGWRLQAKQNFFNFYKDPRKILDDILSCSPDAKRILKIIFNQNKQNEIVSKKGNITKKSLFQKMKEMKIPCYKRQKIFDEIMEVADLV